MFNHRISSQDLQEDELQRPPLLATPVTATIVSPRIPPPVTAPRSRTTTHQREEVSGMLPTFKSQVMDEEEQGGLPVANGVLIGNTTSNDEALRTQHRDIVVQQRTAPQYDESSTTYDHQLARELDTLLNHQRREDGVTLPDEGTISQHEDHHAVHSYQYQDQFSISLDSSSSTRTSRKASPSPPTDRAIEEEDILQSAEESIEPLVVERTKPTASFAKKQFFEEEEAVADDWNLALALQAAEDDLISGLQRQSGYLSDESEVFTENEISHVDVPRKPASVLRHAPNLAMSLQEEEQQEEDTTKPLMSHSELFMPEARLSDEDDRKPAAVVDSNTKPRAVPTKNRQKSGELIDVDVALEQYEEELLSLGGGAALSQEEIDRRVAESLQAEEDRKAQEQLDYEAALEMSVGYRPTGTKILI